MRCFPHNGFSYSASSKASVVKADMNSQARLWNFLSYLHNSCLKTKFMLNLNIIFIYYAYSFLKKLMSIHLCIFDGCTYCFAFILESSTGQVKVAIHFLLQLDT